MVVAFLLKGIQRQINSSCNRWRPQGLPLARVIVAFSLHPQPNKESEEDPPVVCSLVVEGQEVGVEEIEEQKR